MTSRSTVYVGTAVMPDGRVVAAGTSGTENRIADAETWEPLFTWEGEEITACGTIGDRVVCAGTRGSVFVVDASWGIRTIVIDDGTAWINAVGTCRGGVGLVAGSAGRVYSVDVERSTATRWSLGDHGIDKPGRDILRISSIGGAPVVAGKKELLVAYRGGAWVDLAPPPRQETFLYGATELGDDLWLAALERLRPVLVAVPRTGGPRVPHELPLEGVRAPSICTFKGQLVVASSSLIVGLPGRWRVIATLVENDAIAVIPDERTDTVLVVGYTGRSRRLSLRASA